MCVAFTTGNLRATITGSTADNLSTLSVIALMPVVSGSRRFFGILAGFRQFLYNFYYRSGA